MPSEKRPTENDWAMFGEYISDCPSAYWTGLFERIRDYALDLESRLQVVEDRLLVRGDSNAENERLREDIAELEKRAKVLCDLIQTIEELRWDDSLDRLESKRWAEVVNGGQNLREILPKEHTPAKKLII